MPPAHEPSSLVMILSSRFYWLCVFCVPFSSNGANCHHEQLGSKQLDMLDHAAHLLSMSSPASNSAFILGLLPLFCLLFPLPASRLCLHWSPFNHGSPLNPLAWSCRLASLAPSVSLLALCSLICVLCFSGPQDELACSPILDLFALMVHENTCLLDLLDLSSMQAHDDSCVYLLQPPYPPLCVLYKFVMSQFLCMLASPPPFVYAQWSMGASVCSFCSTNLCALLVHDDCECAHCCPHLCAVQIHDEFASKVVDVVRRMRQGPALGDNPVDCGAMCMPGATGAAASCFFWTQQEEKQVNLGKPQVI